MGIESTGMSTSNNGRQREIAPTETLVYLVRHGETAWNAERRFQGQLDVELSAKGIEQAQAVAEWLASQDVNFSALYTSDLQRAAQTAEIIGNRLALEPQWEVALREINAGEWQGMLATEVEQRYPGQLAQWDREVDNFTVPGGESIPLVQKRVFARYNEIVASHPGQAIILISHGAALSALLAALHNWDLLETWHTRKARMGNTGVSVVRFDHERSAHESLIINSFEHLGEPSGMEHTMDPNPKQRAAY
jgi:broad specificity phosphatase PhoE